MWFRRILVFLLLVFLNNFVRAENLLVIYEDNYAYINEEKVLDIPVGKQEIKIFPFPISLQLNSVNIEFLSDNVDLKEFCYLFDDEEKLLQKSVGKKVILETEGKNYEGELKEFNNSTIFLLQDKILNLIKRDTISNIKLLSIPQEIYFVPTIKAKVINNSEKEKIPTQISYFASQIGWQVDYTILKNDDFLNLEAKISLVNNSGKDYFDSTLILMSGNIKKGQQKQVLRAPAYFAEESFISEEVFEYHSYKYPEKINLVNGENICLDFVKAKQVPYVKKYRFKGEVEKNPSIIISFINDKENNLGVSLPPGQVRLYEGDIFIGEDQITHTPVGKEIELIVGKAFDVSGERKEISYKKITEKITERTYEIKLTNYKPEDIKIIVEENLFGDWEIINSNFPYLKKDVQTIEFEVEVPSQKEVVINYTARFR